MGDGPAWLLPDQMHCGLSVRARGAQAMEHPIRPSMLTDHWRP
jgi:hypothetical protein